MIKWFRNRPPKVQDLQLGDRIPKEAGGLYYGRTVESVFVLDECVGVKLRDGGYIQFIPGRSYKVF